jgi:hypothetical protein
VGVGTPRAAAGTTPTTAHRLVVRDLSPGRAYEVAVLHDGRRVRRPPVRFATPELPSVADLNADYGDQRHAMGEPTAPPLKPR